MLVFQLSLSLSRGLQSAAFFLFPMTNTTHANPEACERRAGRIAEAAAHASSFRLLVCACWVLRV